MNLSDDKATLTPAEAKKRFGELLDQRTRTYMHFDAEDGGIWRPRLGEDMRLIDYQLWRPARTAKARPAWRPKGK